MLPARSLPFELVHEDEFQISQRKAVHRRLGIFMGLVEGHRERGSIRITPVFPKVAIGTWFHPGDQDLPWIVGTELPRVTLPYGAVTHGCAQEDPLGEVVRPCQPALPAGWNRSRVPFPPPLHSV